MYLKLYNRCLSIYKFKISKNTNCLLRNCTTSKLNYSPISTILTDSNYNLMIVRNKKIQLTSYSTKYK